MLNRLFAAAILVGALLSAGELTAQPAAPDTTTLQLERLLREAAQENPSLRAARLQAEALHTKGAQAGALPDPMAGLVYQPYPLLTARGFQRTQWRLEQQIPFPGKLGLRREVATLGAQVADADAEAFGQDLGLQIREAYYELYRAQEQDRLIQHFQEELEYFEEAATTRYEVGSGSQQAILKAQIERGRLDVQREELSAERQSALKALARLTGRADLGDPEAPVQVAPPTEATQGAEALSAALEARPEAEALRRTIERADREEALAQRAFLPDFTVGVTYFDLGNADLTPAMTGRDAVAFNVGVKIPLWLGKQRARLEEAQLERRHAETRLEALRLDIRTEVEDLQSRLERQERQLSLLDERLIPQAQAAQEATLSAYTTGRTDFLDLLDAERTLFQLQMDYEQTFARYLKTTAALERTLGRAALPLLRQ